MLAHTHIGITPAPTPDGVHGLSFLAVAPEHSVAVMGLVFLPVVLVALAALADLFSARVQVLATMVASVARASFSTRLALLLMLTTADIHFVLIPGHMAEDPARAVLFALNGAAFLAVCGLALMRRPWRGTAAVLTAATIAAYGFYVVGGREDVDLIGWMTKVIEIAALGAIATSAITDPERARQRIKHQLHQRTKGSQRQEVLG